VIGRACGGNSPMGATYGYLDSLTGGLFSAFTASAKARHGDNADSQ